MKPRTDKGGLSEKEKRELAALDGAYAARPDVGVMTLLHEARDLERSAKKHVSVLTSGADLPKNALADLARRASMLERAQADWDGHRRRRVDPALEALRGDGEQKRRAAGAALRYFCRQDHDVQARLDEIAEGSGDADLVDDLRRLAVLVRENGALLKKAKLGANAAGALERSAKNLGDAIASRGDEDDGGFVDLRNRAFWYLRASIEEIRAAARYVFRDDARKLAKYLSTGILKRRNVPAPRESSDRKTKT